MFSKARKVATMSVAAAAGVLALGAFGSPAMAATLSAAPASSASHLDPRCDCLPGPAPLPKPVPAPAPAPEPPAPAPTTPTTPSTPSTGSVACPAQVPSHPTGVDYVNAWNLSGTCLGAGAAGLVSSAWAGAIPSIIQGAAGSLSSAGAKSDEPAGLTAPVVVPSHPTGADYVNAWNKSGALAGGGAAGLVSSAWAGAIPSIVQGAAGSLSTSETATNTTYKSATAKSHPARKSTKVRTYGGEGVSAPVVVPSNPTGADYVNAWNKSGALAGGGAAGLVSSAWAGAIPSIIQGALGSLG